MNKRLTWTELTLNLKNPFTVSYGSSTTRTAYWIRLDNDEGWGEGTIPFYYGIDFKTMTDYWDRAAQKQEPFPESIEEIPQWIDKTAPSPAQTALDIAFYDRIGKQQHKPIYELLGVPKPQPMITSYTISIDTPEAMAAMADSIQNYPYIKIKLGAPGEEDLDEKRLKAIRAVRPDARLRIDANAGWKADDAIRLVKRLEKFNLELIEQPTAKKDFQGMGRVQSETAIPIVADESVQTIEDIDRLHAAGVQGINLKLMKCGGLTNGLLMLKRAKSYGMKVMLGCMVETSVGVGAMTHLMGLADWIDLDTPMLISNDPFRGLHYTDQAELIPPTGFGIGLELKSDR
ncbi:MAG: dipeptide epimerase [Flexilinea flocculi]|jgi:L-alanine-DL-glutamate epimerase-like enolase superfamily enzyme|nr:dipeptide epimerase [Flexilinea flocculi]